MLEFRSFSQQNHLAYAGAEMLDKSEPFISEIAIDLSDTIIEADVIVADSGIEIYNEEYWYNLHFESPRGAAAVLRLKPKMTHEELISLGFSMVHSLLLIKQD